MDRFLRILANIRVAAAEVGGTVSLLLLMLYGAYKAWEDFGAKILK